MKKCKNLIKFQGPYKPHQRNYHSVIYKLLTLLNSHQIIHKQKNKRNTLTTTNNLHRVIFDNITISTIKTSVDIKRYIYKYTDNQIHIKYTWWNMWNTKGGICVEVKSEEQKQLLISKANIIFPGYTAKTPSSPFESQLISKTLIC